ncbi:unnamed protein product [Auanema sp. JU1783]|nr:unnamed protein product [Auanema sp. JU1783]
METLPIVDEIALVPRDVGGEEDSSAVDSITIVSRAEKKKNKLVKKFNRNPLSFYQVIIIGIIVLIIIIGCVAVETYISTNKLRPNVHPHSSDDEKYHRRIVDKVNSQNIAWKAKYNRFASRSVDDGSSSGDAERSPILERLKMSPQQLLQDTKQHLKELLHYNMSIPTVYDTRFKYPQCWSVHQIYNQAGCGSCWSVAASSVMSDRICISSNGTTQIQISALDLTSCCHTCGGCQGTHWALSAFTYWKEHGVVSGGSYGTHEGCRPYTIEPDCGSPCSSSQYSKERTPSCTRECRPHYDRKYDEDITKSRRAYWIRAFHGSAEFTLVKVTLDDLVGDKYVSLIQKEILLHGPVLACFTLYEDFQHYSSGIYSVDEMRSEQLYGHCAKLLGWGVEDNKKYWLYSNTWGRDWGENGFFRVSFDEIPEEVVAGVL